MNGNARYREPARNIAGIVLAVGLVLALAWGITTTQRAAESARHAAESADDNTQAIRSVQETGSPILQAIQRAIVQIRQNNEQETGNRNTYTALTVACAIAILQQEPPGTTVRVGSYSKEISACAQHRLRAPSAGRR